MAVKNVTEERGTLGALLRLPYETLARRIYAELRMTYPEVRPAHSSVFRHIRPDGSRLTELADRAQMTKQSMSYLVESLVECGCVEVGPDPADGRAKRVTLTRKGNAVLAKLLEISVAAEEEAAETIGRDAMAYLRDLLSRLGRAIEATSTAK